MKNLILFLILSSCFVGLCNADNDVATKIKELELQLADAIVHQDIEAVQRLEAETYVHTDATGKVSTREDFIRSYRSGTSDIKSVKFDQLVVDIYDNAAVVRGIATVQLSKENVTRVARYTRFYVHFPDGWRAVAGHSS